MKAVCLGLLLSSLAPLAAEILDAELDRGPNRLLLKICNAGPVKRDAGERDTVKYLETLSEGPGSELTWGFCARLCDAGGQRRSGLVTSLSGPGQPLFFGKLAACAYIPSI